MTTLVLDVHRTYACEHAGACCRSGWTIPVESACYDVLEDALRTGHLSALNDQDTAPLLPFPARTGDYAGLLGVHDDGRCVFLEELRPLAAGPQRHLSCAIHRRLGHAALPFSCRQFPRVAVMRPSSTAVSVSHYCPTATGLLFRGAATLSLEPAPAALVDDHVWEGLDLRESLPPLLRHDALFTWSAFDRWEQFVISTLADRAHTLEQALATIAAGAEAVRTWHLDAGPLEAYVETGLEEVRLRAPHAPVPSSHAATADEAMRLVSLAIPPDVQHSFSPWVEPPAGCATGDTLVPDEEVWRRYLAARAWASWVAHESGGVRGHVRWLLVVLGTLRACVSTSLFDAIRHADLLLMHLASPAAMARLLARADDVPLSAATLTADAPPRGRGRARSAGRKPRVPVK